MNSFSARSRFLGAIVLLGSIAARAADAPAASRPAQEGCVWQQLSSAAPKFSVLAQECELGSRKTTHTIDAGALIETYSEGGGKGEKVIELFAKDPGDAPAPALQKQFIAKLGAYERKHCVARQILDPAALRSPFADKTKSAWEIAPDKAYAAKIKKETPKDDMPGPSCGPRGAPVDELAYFEFHSGSAQFAWVDAGQDEPLFDEQSLAF